jgi:hypothetical protein
MKQLLLLSAFIISSCISFGQYTFHATSYQTINIETDEESETTTYYQIFSVSLRDKYLVHTVFGSYKDAVTDSQLYRIVEVTEDDEDGFTMITCRSGVTGKEYIYLFNFDDEDNPIFARQVDEEEFTNYKGKLTTFKTYLQEGEDDE